MVIQEKQERLDLLVLQDREVPMGKTERKVLPELLDHLVSQEREESKVLLV